MDGSSRTEGPNCLSFSGGRRHWTEGTQPSSVSSTCKIGFPVSTIPEQDPKCKIKEGHVNEMR